MERCEVMTPHGTAGTHGEAPTQTQQVSAHWELGHISPGPALVSLQVSRLLHQPGQNQLTLHGQRNSTSQEKQAFTVLQIHLGSLEVLRDISATVGV